MVCYHPRLSLQTSEQGDNDYDDNQKAGDCNPHRPTETPIVFPGCTNIRPDRSETLVGCEHIHDEVLNHYHGGQEGCNGES